MNCEQVQDRFDRYVAGTLSLPERSALDAHLAECAACRAELARVRPALVATAALPRSIDPPEDLWPSIASRIDQKKVVPGRFGVRSGGSRWMSPRLLAAAAVALVVVSSSLTFLATRKLAQTEVVRGGAMPTEFLAVEAQYTRASDEILFALQQGEVRITPETRAILERNLRVIDAAIAESRTALLSDPANEELKEMVLSTYEHKLDLLRRVTYPRST